jgi:hypothetical protein
MSGKSISALPKLKRLERVDALSDFAFTARPASRIHPLKENINEDRTIANSTPFSGSCGPHAILRHKQFSF